MSILGLNGIIYSNRVPGIDSSDGLGEYIADNVVSAETWPDSMSGTPDDLTAAVGEVPIKQISPSVARGRAGLLFNGIDDKFSRGAKLINGPSFSSAHVVRVDSFPIGSEMVWAQRSGSTDLGLYITNAGNVAVVLGPVSIVGPPGTIILGRTYHIFIEYEGAEPRLKVWVNNVLFTDHVPSQTPTFTGTDLVIGADPVAGLFFQGMHFFHKFWNKAIFSEEPTRLQIFNTLVRMYGIFGYEYEESTFTTIPITYEYQESNFIGPPTVTEYEESSWDNLLPVYEYKDDHTWIIPLPLWEYKDDHSWDLGVSVWEYKDDHSWP